MQHTLRILSNHTSNKCRCFSKELSGCKHPYLSPMNAIRDLKTIIRFELFWRKLINSFKSYVFPCIEVEDLWSKAMSNKMGIYNKIIRGLTKNIDKPCEQCLSVQSAIKLSNLKLRKKLWGKNICLCVYNINFYSSK